MTVAYEELPGSGKLTANPLNITGTRILKVAWSDVIPLITELWGTAYETGSTIFRTPLATYPGQDYMLLVGMDSEPMFPDYILLDDNGNATYPDGAKVTLSYTSVDWDISPSQNQSNQPYVSVSLEIGGEIMSLPAAGLQWAAANVAGSKSVPDTVTAGMIIPTSSLKLDWHYVPTLPLATLRALRGNVNSVPFLGAAAGTVLFMGATATRNFQPGSQSNSWEIGLRFEEKSVVAPGTGQNLGWNYFYRPDSDGSDGSQFELLVQKTGGAVYSAADLNSIFG